MTGRSAIDPRIHTRTYGRWILAACLTCPLLPVVDVVAGDPPGAMALLIDVAVSLAMAGCLFSLYVRGVFCRLRAIALDDAALTITRTDGTATVIARDQLMVKRGRHPDRITVLSRDKPWIDGVKISLASIIDPGLRAVLARHGADGAPSAPTSATPP